MSRYISIEDLNSIDPMNLHYALEINGWRLIDTRPDLFSVFEDPSSDSDILVPLDPSYSDYLARLNEALIGVEAYLGERARPLLGQLVAGLMDELFFVREVSTIRGSVKWRTGQHLYDAARESLRAAAKSSEEHLPYYGNRVAGPARRYINGVRMGQTKESSFIVTALVPVTSKDDFEIKTLPGLEDRRPGFYRNSTAALFQASQAALDAAEEFESRASFEPFVESVHYGVSAELLTALAFLGSDNSEGEIRVEWSPAIDKPGNTPDRVTVRPDHVGALRTAANRFQSQAEVNTVSVSGNIVGLDRAKYGDSGITRMRIVSGSPARMARIRLSREQYDQAIEAHRNGNLVRITGDLAREGNFYWIYNVRDFLSVPDLPEAIADDGVEELPWDDLGAS